MKQHLLPLQNINFNYVKIINFIKHVTSGVTKLTHFLAVLNFNPRRTAILRIFPCFSQSIQVNARSEP